MCTRNYLFRAHRLIHMLVMLLAKWRPNRTPACPENSGLCRNCAVWRVRPFSEWTEGFWSHFPNFFLCIGAIMYGIRFSNRFVYVTVQPWRSPLRMCNDYFHRCCYCDDCDCERKFQPVSSTCRHKKSTTN